MYNQTIPLDCAASKLLFLLHHLFPELHFKNKNTESSLVSDNDFLRQILWLYFGYTSTSTEKNMKWKFLPKSGILMSREIQNTEWIDISFTGLREGPIFFFS